MKKRLLNKLLSNGYAKTGKNYEKRCVNMVKILARHYFAHWDNLGQAFVVERIPNKRKSIIWGKPPKTLTYRISKHYFERINKKLGGKCEKEIVK